MSYADQLRARMAAQFRATGGHPHEWYTMRNLAGEDRALVHLYGIIGDTFWGEGVTAADFTRDLRAIDARTIELHMDSDGGSIHEGITIYNALRDHSARVEVVVDGRAASAASFVAQAGDLITMNRFSEMMIHDGLALTLGNADDHYEMGALLDKASDNIAAIYANRAGGDVADWRAAMKAETWYSADEAVAVGLADEVVSDEVPDAIDATPRALLATARARVHHLERTA